MRIGCVKSKRDHPAEACDLYTSPLIEERRQGSRSVVDDLERRIGPLEHHTFELHAGSDYLD